MERLTLKDILPHLNFCADIRLLDDADKGENPEPLFEGGVLDIPWSYLEGKLATDDDGEAINAGVRVNSKGVKIPMFTIYLDFSR